MPAVPNIPATPAIPIITGPVPTRDEHYHFWFGGRQLTGVTRFINQFSKPFDSEYWANRKAKERGDGTTKEQILAEWDAKGKAACDLGHRVHFQAEVICDGFGGDQEPDGYTEAIEAAISELKITPVATERVICDPELGLSGIVDLVCFIGDSQEPAIVDWKTNRKGIEFRNRWQKMLTPLGRLDDCSYHHYALQLSLYRFILERHYNFRPTRQCLIYLPGDGTYRPIPAPYMRQEIDDITNFATPATPDTRP